MFNLTEVSKDLNVMCIYTAKRGGVQRYTSAVVYVLGNSPKVGIQLKSLHGIVAFPTFVGQQIIVGHKLCCDNLNQWGWFIINITI